jgi:hypothetical protein
VKEAKQLTPLQATLQAANSTQSNNNYNSQQKPMK